jgi:hypothetical protein
MKNIVIDITRRRKSLKKQMRESFLHVDRKYIGRIDNMLKSIYVLKKHGIINKANQEQYIKTLVEDKLRFQILYWNPDLVFKFETHFGML